jgi:hypothetical protein
MIDILEQMKHYIDGGTNIRYLMYDVKEGSLIAYLINKNDKNINRPIANLNIKPYINEFDSNDFILQADTKMYGNGNDKFKDMIDDWCREVNGDKAGYYCLNPNLYMDNKDKRIKYEPDDDFTKTWKSLANIYQRGISNISLIGAAYKYMMEFKKKLHPVGYDGRYQLGLIKMLKDKTPEKFLKTFDKVFTRQ